MSIYPKNICKEENVIIHLRFSNKGPKPQMIKYKLDVRDPYEKQVFYKEDDICLGIDKEEYVKQLYYSLYINDNFKPGKYLVDFCIICNGHIIESITKDNDFFYVESLEYYNSENNTIIENNSPEKARFKVFKEGIFEEFEIEGKQKMKLKEKYDYIEFANNKFDMIKEK